MKDVEVTVFEEKIVQFDVKEEEIVQFDELNDVLKNEILEKKVLALEYVAGLANEFGLDG